MGKECGRNVEGENNTKIIEKIKNHKNYMKKNETSEEKCNAKKV